MMSRPALTPRRVVVTGMGAVSPLGNDLARSWEAAKNGRSGVGLIRGFDAQHWPVRIAGEVRGFNVAPFLDPAQRDLAECMPRGLQFGVAAAAMALDEAGLPASAVAPPRLGIAMGAMSGALSLETQNEFRRFLSQPPPIAYRQQFTRQEVLDRPQIGVAEVMGRRWHAAGPFFILSTACAASTQALGVALRTIQAGRADVMIAGGFDAHAQESGISGFVLLGALSRRNDEPERASRPFDRLRDGFVIGEGAAVLILEDLEHAVRRGAGILAELAGYGASLTTSHITDSVPDGSVLARAMTLALEDAGVPPAGVGHVNAHGTATRDNDRSESAGIRQAFGNHADRLAVSSTKSMTGHLLHAAGALEAAFAVLALRDQVAPPTINYENPDPYCNLDYVPNRAREMDLEAVVSNSFAFGGNNASLVFKKFTDPRKGDRTSECKRSCPRFGGAEKKRRIVITGRGVISPLGHSPQSLVDGWMQGRSAVGPIRSIDATHLPSRIAAEITDFVARERVGSRKLLRLLQRGEDFAVAAAAAAFQDAKLTPADLDPARSGIAVGCAKEGPPLENYFPALEISENPDATIDRSRFAQAGLPLIPPLTILQGLPNSCLYHLAQLYRLEGVNWNFLSYGGGAALALAESLRAVGRGEADLMLAGGFDSWMLWCYPILYAQLGLLSRANEAPGQAHRPVPEKGTGPFAFRGPVPFSGGAAGEGAGFVLLEDAAHARARHAPIHGELLVSVSGVGLGPDGAESPARVLADSISQALNEAGCRPQDIDLVHAHGDATPEGDRWEAEALARVMGPHAGRVPVTTIKPATGNLGNAAAAVELIAVLELMKRGIVPPILNLRSPDPAFPLRFVQAPLSGIDLKRALLLNRGWPSHFTVLLIQRWEE